MPKIIKKTFNKQQKACKGEHLCYNDSEMRNKITRREALAIDQQHRAALKNESLLGNAPEEVRTFSDRLQEAHDLKSYE